MADETKTLEFKITTVAELAGAQSFANSLEMQIGKAKALKQDYSALSDQLKTVQTSISEAKIAQVAETEASTVAATATEGLTLKKRELVEALRLVNMQFPLLADAERAFFEPLVAQIFIATGAIVALGKAFSDAYDEMQGVQVPDLTKGIEDATNLATAWDGIRSAIAKANEEFNSAQAIYERALKGAETLSGAARLQEQLTAKADFAANAQAQADAAKRRADAFKLPQNDDDAKKQADALREEAEAYKRDADTRGIRGEQISEAALTAGQGGISGAASIFTAGFWKDLGSRITSVWTGARPTFGDAETYARSQQDQAKEENKIAQRLQRRADEEDAKIKERESARQEADRTAAQAQTAKDDYSWESNSNNSGSIAEKIQQQHAQAVDSLNQMGVATAVGLSKLTEKAKEHTASINQIIEALDQQKTVNHRLQNMVNNHF